MRYVVVDAFASEPFMGNPAAVVLAGHPLAEATMQRLAAEFHLSETAFPVPRAAGDGFDLRWFTPTAEVALCGHATLAAAHALWTEGALDVGAEAVFHTKSGRLACRRLADGQVAMAFPATPPAAVPTPDGLAAALGADPVWTGRSAFDLVVRLSDAETVRRLAPDLAALERLDARGVVVTAPGDDGYDLVSRFFGPRVGVPEDPVTGSAHCALGPYWAAELGRGVLRAWQASPRGGALTVAVDGDRVTLVGGAVAVLRGEVAVPLA